MFMDHVVLAYIGPGLGLGAIGTISMVFFGFLVMILGFVFYPVKVFIKNFRNKKGQTPSKK